MDGWNNMGMSRITGRPWGRRRHLVCTWTLWAAFFLVVAGFVVLGSERTVTPVYRQAAEHWLRGEPLYSNMGRGFIYLPQAAVLFTPLAAFTAVLGDVLWRLVILSVFSIGVWRLAQLGEQDAGADLFPLFPMMTFVAIPLALDGARNGQATLPCVGLMILAVAALTRVHWWRATLWLMLGLAVKPLITFLIVLTVVLYRPMRGKVVAGLAILSLAPFLFQRPEYVISQYRQWVTMVGAAGQIGMDASWAQIYGLLAVLGVTVSSAAQVGIGGAAALLTIGLAVAARRRHSSAQAGVLLFSLNVCYLMLFNLRTENNTYAALAPAVGVFAAQAWVKDRRPFVGAGLLAIAVGITGSFEIGRRVASHLQPVWLAPLMGVCFATFVVVRVVNSGRERAASGAARAAGEPA